MKKYLFIILIFIFTFNSFSNYEKALDLYKRAIDYLNIGKTELAISTYYDSIKEDKKILALKDYGLSQMLIYKIKKQTPSIEGATLLMLYGYSDDARAFIMKSLSQLSPASQDYIKGQELLKQLEALKSQDSTLPSKKQEKLNLNNTKMDNQKKKNMALDQKRTYIKRQITNLNSQIEDLKAKIDAQKKITEKSKKYHKMWFGLHYGNYANNTDDDTTYYNLEQFYNEQYENEQKKLDALNQQMQSLESNMENLTNQMNILNSQIEENSKKDINIGN